MNKILETKKLSAGYGALRVLHEIDFSIAEGERIAIVGLNGHGKTTLFRSLTHLVGWQQGSILLNGEEIAGGSIRIHKEDIQKSIFKALKIDEKEAKEKFGFLLDAFKYGAPPHGGIAFGFDRLVAIMCGEDSIREVIAFPKNKDAKDLMLNAPSSVNKSQLNELGLKTK